MSRIKSAFLPSFGCAISVVATLVLIGGRLDVTSAILSGAFFAAMFGFGVVAFSFARGHSVGAHATAGGVTTLLAYPASILLLSLVAQVVRSTGFTILGSDPNEVPGFLDIWLTAISIWILPALVVSLALTVPVGTLAGCLIGFARQMDACRSSSTKAKKQRLKNQLILTVTLFILASVLIAGRLASLPLRTEESVLERPAPSQVIVQE